VGLDPNIAPVKTLIAIGNDIVVKRADVLMSSNVMVVAAKLVAAVSKNPAAKNTLRDFRNILPPPNR
jgi:hypothetical protein